jgi:hypothetical protein
MSKQWKATTRGGDPVENVRPNNDGIWKWVGDIINRDGSRLALTWTERGYYGADEHPRRDDLIPIEPEAPSSAKVRVDLALAAMRHKAHCDALKLAEDVLDESKRLLFNTFVAAGKTDVVVKIDGEHYHFWLNEITPRFRKIEVL